MPETEPPPEPSSKTLRVAQALLALVVGIIAVLSVFASHKIEAVAIAAGAAAGVMTTPELISWPVAPSPPSWMRPAFWGCAMAVGLCVALGRSLQVSEHLSLAWVAFLIALVAGGFALFVGSVQVVGSRWSGASPDDRRFAVILLFAIAVVMSFAAAFRS